MSIRKYTNPRELDLSKGLQEVLRNNGIQAHICITQDGVGQLVVLGHDSPVLRYELTDKQIEDLMNWGNNYANKKAYNTFTGIVKDDFYMPDSFVAARNVGGSVITGLHGYRIGNGEYGYRSPGVPPFQYLHTGLRGWGGDFLTYRPRLFSPGFHGRRIDGRYFGNGPMVAERPDGRLKPGELRSGGYGFYYKGQENGTSQEVLNFLTVSENKIEPLKAAPRPVGQATPYNSIISSDVYFSVDSFYGVLKSHGILVNTEEKTLTIQSSDARVDLQYNLSEEEIKQILAQDIKGEGSVSIQKRLDVINQVIKGDFSDMITLEMLNSKSMVNVKLKPDVKAEVEAKFIERDRQIQAQEARLAQKHQYEAAQQAEIARLQEETSRIQTDPNAIDGRQIRNIMGNYGFFADTSHGRQMVVGEIRVDETRGGHYVMTATINGEKVTHGISERQYQNFLNLNDEHRLRLFADIFKEVKIEYDKNQAKTPVLTNIRDENGDFITREQAEIEHANADYVDGGILKDIKSSKGFYREIENGREVNIETVRVEKLSEDKFRMTAVVEGETVSHEIRQRDYDKFLAVDDYQRLKLFSKIFPEVEIKSRPEARPHIGAAILAAVVAGAEAAIDISCIVQASRHDHIHRKSNNEESHGPTIYEKPGVVSAHAVAVHNFEENLGQLPNNDEIEIGRGHGL